jgi:hypothetical protein
MIKSRVLGALKPFVIRNHLFVWAGNTDVPLRPVPASYEFSFPYDVPSLTDAALSDVEIDRATLMRRHEEGDLFGLIMFEGKIIYRILVQTRGTPPMEGDRYAFKLGAGQGYVHSGFTALEHRGKNLHPTMMRQIGGGYAKGQLFVACRQENAPGAQAIVRAGFAYLKSDVVVGFAHGRVRLRRWYRDSKMAEPAARDRPAMPPAPK